MVKSKIIKTKRLLIEPFSSKYLSKKYVSWLNNPRVVYYSRQRHKKHTMTSCRKYFNSFKETPHFFWAISVKRSNLGHIGNIVALVDKFNETADLSILIGETKAWGKGYASEAWKAVCSYFFKKQKIRKITARSLANNKRMLKLMERTGMINGSRTVKHCLWQGKEVDTIQRVIFREDFLK